MTDFQQKNAAPLNGLQFSLTSLLLTISFVSVCAATFRWGRLVGVLSLAYLVPAFARTVILVILAIWRGKEVNLTSRLREMGLSLMLMIPVLCVGSTGFLLGGFAAGLLFQIGLVTEEIGAAFAIAMGVIPMLVTWGLTLRVSLIEE